MCGKGMTRKAFTKHLPTLARSTNIFMRYKPKEGNVIYRYIQGPNVLKFIGFGRLRSLPDERDYTDKFLQELSGNAFNGPQLAAVLTGLVIGYGSL